MLAGTPRIFGGIGGSSTSPLPVTDGGTGTSTAFTKGSVIFAGTAGTYSQDNAKFFWDDTNFRLGIGTAVPNTPLEVVGTTGGVIRARNTSATASTELQLLNDQNSTGNALALGFGGSSYAGFSGLTGQFGYLGTNGNFPFGIYTNNAIRMTVLGAGNVGIGTVTPASNYKLSVTGAGGGIAIGAAVTANPSWASTSDVIVIGSAGSISSNNNSSAITSLSTNTVFNGTSKYVMNGFAQSLTLDGSGNMTFATAPSGTAGANTTFTTVFEIFNNGTMSNTGGIVTHRTAVADVAYTVLTTDYIVAYTTLTATRAVTLLASPTTGQMFIFKDEAGTAGTNNITFVGTIDGATNKAINSNYGVLRIYWNGTNYSSW